MLLETFTIIPQAPIDAAMPDITYSDVIKNLEDRDIQDSTRKDSPLMVASTHTNVAGNTWFAGSTW